MRADRRKRFAVQLLVDADQRDGVTAGSSAARGEGGNVEARSARSVAPEADKR